MEIVDDTAFFRSLFERANDTIVAFDNDGIIAYINPSCHWLLGYRPNEVIGRNFIDFLHKDDLDRAAFAIGQIHRQPFGLSTGSYRIHHADGTWVPVDVTASHTSHNGQQLLVVYLRYSATPQMERQVLMGLLGGAPLSEVFVAVLNSIAWRELGSHMAIRWPEAHEWRSVHTGLPDALRGDVSREPWKSVYETGIGVTCNDLDDLEDAERTVASQHGFGGYWIESVTSTDAQGAALITIWTLADRTEPQIHEFGMDTAKSYVGVIRQFTAQRQMLDHAANHDPLTGLANRKALDSALEDMTSGAVLYCDLDRFKPVNDVLGHAVGDDLLEAVARRLSGRVRTGDVVARIGGDEFVIVSPGLDALGAEQLATRVLDAIAEPFTLGTHTVEIGTSIGLACADSIDTSTIARADRAMYDAKEAGRGQFRWAP